jgi:hypothetical protein
MRCDDCTITLRKSIITHPYFDRHRSSSPTRQAAAADPLRERWTRVVCAPEPIDDCGRRGTLDCRCRCRCRLLSASTIGGLGHGEKALTPELLCPADERRSARRHETATRHAGMADSSRAAAAAQAAAATNTRPGRS